MITGLEHNYRDLIHPPALSGQDGESTPSLDHTTGFTRISLKHPHHSPSISLFL